MLIMRKTKIKYPWTSLTTSKIRIFTMVFSILNFLKYYNAVAAALHFNGRRRRCINKWGRKRIGVNGNRGETTVGAKGIRGETTRILIFHTMRMLHIGSNKIANKTTYLRQTHIWTSWRPNQKMTTYRVCIIFVQILLFCSLDTYFSPLYVFILRL
jgi:hypothetical protein